MRKSADTGHNMYDDLIYLPHHVSKTRKPMSMAERAAQFAPFAALTGYEESLNETARITDQKIELDENAIEELDARLQFLADHLSDKPEITAVYFVKDEKKSGGAYVEVTERVKKIDATSRTLLLEIGTVIPIDDLFSLHITHENIFD